MADVSKKTTREPAHILVADDVPHICRLLEINLRRAGYRVTCVDCLSEAGNVVERDHPDVVVLDAWLLDWSDMNIARMKTIFVFAERFETLRAVKPPIIFTVRQSTDIKVLSKCLPLLECPSAYMVKPYYPMEVLHMIRWLLEPGEHILRSRI